MTDADNINTEDVRFAYDQEWQQYRYQDTLRWSKIKDVALIELAYLIGVYGFDLDFPRGAIVTMFASILVVVFLGLAIKDGEAAQRHLNRQHKFSAAMKIPPFEQCPILEGRGKALMWAAIFLVNFLNVLVFIDQICIGNTFSI